MASWGEQYNALYNKITNMQHEIISINNETNRLNYQKYELLREICDIQNVLRNIPKDNEHLVQINELQTKMNRIQSQVPSIEEGFENLKRRRQDF